MESKVRLKGVLMVEENKWKNVAYLIIIFENLI